MSEQQTFENEITVNVQPASVEQVHCLLNSLFDVIPSLFHCSKHEVACCEFRPARIHSHKNLKNLSIGIAAWRGNSIQLVHMEVFVMIQDRMELLKIRSYLAFPAFSLVWCFRRQDFLKFVIKIVRLSAASSNCVASIDPSSRLASSPSLPLLRLATKIPPSSIIFRILKSLLGREITSRMYGLLKNAPILFKIGAIVTYQNWKRLCS